MKRSTLFAIITLLILLTIFGIFVPLLFLKDANKDIDKINQTETKMNINKARAALTKDIEELCFQKTILNKKTQNANTKTNASSSPTSSMAIKVLLYPDRSVTGRLNFLPNEKDKLTGPFTGTWEVLEDKKILTISHEYFADGVSSTTSGVITLSVAFAVVNWNGSKDSDGVAVPSKDRIPRVSCDLSEVVE